MLASRTSRLALLTVLGTGLVAAPNALAASAATPRYASPAGSGTACTSSSPCEITQAITSAGSGGEVIVNPGDYPLTATPPIPNQITIHGVAGRPRPRLLFSGGNQSGMFLPGGTVLRYLEIVQAAPSTSALFSSAAKMDQIVVSGSSGSTCTAVFDNSTIRNSVVVAPGSDATAICTGEVVGLTNMSSYRNVTAVATGSGGVAIEAYALGSGSKATVELVNVIAKGGPGGASVAMRTDSSSGAEATITARHTNWASYWTSGTNAHFVDGGGNQGTPPHFVQPDAGDYRQAPGSATIDAGIDEPINGAFDVDGDPRGIGATDIGADEFVVSPAAITGLAGAVTDRSATVGGSVNPNGAPTTYRFEYGPTTAYGATAAGTGAGSGTSAVPAAATLDALNPATTYHYRLVATNAGGVTKGADQTFTTASPPPSTPTAPPPGPTPASESSTSETATTQPPAVTQVFAGVKLVSTGLAFGGRFITLKLSCPAETVGGCSGLTKLSARRQATSRTASAVTLGRARFSIAAGKQGTIRVRVSRAGQQLLRGTRRLRGKASSAAHDGAGQSKTIVAAVTIRRRYR